MTDPAKRQAIRVVPDNFVARATNAIAALLPPGFGVYLRSTSTRTRGDDSVRAIGIEIEVTETQLDALERLASDVMAITHRVDLEDVHDAIAALRAVPGEQTAQAAITEAVGDGMVMGVRK